MKLRFPSILAVILGGAALLASLTIRPGASAADPAGAASAASSASAVASASAAPGASATAPDAGPALPRFDAEPWSEAVTPLPTPAEWKPTLPVALTDPLPFDCHAYRVREWVKIRCSRLSTSTLTLLGGAREGVYLFIDPPQFEHGASDGGEVVFAVRRGDRRMFEWSTFGDSYDGPGSPEVAFLISEAWVPGEAAPTVIAARPR